MTYKVLIFDLDDTLFDFQAGEKKGLSVVFHQFAQANLPYEDWLLAYKKINQQVWQAIEQGAASQPLLNQRFSKAFEQFGQTIDGQMAEELYRKELDTNYALLDGAKELMDQLAVIYPHLVAGTNGKATTQYQRLANTHFDTYFEHIVISGEIGYSKPSSEFFNFLFSLYPTIPKEEFLMIGDTLGSDILGASNAGIDSVWFNPMKKEVASYSPTFIINRLDQLLSILAH